MSIALAQRADSDRQGTAPVSFGKILVALDQSDYANQAVNEVISLTGPVSGTITGIHAYAAKMHDRRFKQRSEERRGGKECRL